MVVRQGTIYWVDLGDPIASGPGYRRPCVVVQNDLFNNTRLSTTVICALSTNLKLAESPGNVLVPQGEANLPKDSVINTTQILTVDKTQLTEVVGALSADRLRQVLDGLYLLFEPRRFG